MASKPTPAIRKILYVGYEIDDSELVEKLKPVIGDKTSQLRSPIFTVHLYFRESNQPNMQSWYKQSAADSKITGYLRCVYIHETKKTLTIIGEVNIGSSIYYLTFVNDSGISLNNVKLFTNRGDFGKPIVLENKVPIDFKKCIKYD